MQERFYESGSCVQKNCAVLGVHPKQQSPTYDQPTRMTRLISDRLEEPKICDAESYGSTGEQGKVAVKILDGALVLRPFLAPLLSNISNGLLCILDAFSGDDRVRHHGYRSMQCTAYGYGSLFSYFLQK